MNHGVVDASALIRLYIEDGPPAAGLVDLLRSVDRTEAVAMVPDLIWPEVANSLRKKVSRGEISSEEAGRILSDMLDLPLRIRSHRRYVAGALRLALQHELSVYDGLYVELARTHGARLFTCDAALGTVAVDLGLN